MSKVLIVEDEMAIRDLIKIELRFKWIFVRNGGRWRSCRQFVREKCV